MGHGHARLDHAPGDKLTLVAWFYSDSSAEVRTVLSAAVLVGLLAVVLLVLAVGLAPLPFLVVVAALLWWQRREMWDATR